MEKRIDALRQAGTDVEFHRYPDVGCTMSVRLETAGSFKRKRRAVLGHDVLA
jgi:hypothetical protein